MLSRQMLDEMEERLKTLGQHYKTLELHRDNLLSDLKRLAGETIDRVERAKSASRDFDPDQHRISQTRKQKALFPNAELENEIKKSLQQPVPVITETIKTVTIETASVQQTQRSFFDDIQ